MSCDGLDNDCDGATDELDVSAAELCRAGGLCCADGGVCGAGEGPWVVCVEQAPRCVYPPLDGFEADEASCDGLDNDCDGLTDEMTLTAEQACERHGACCLDVGVCGRPELAVGHCAAGAWTCRYEDDPGYEPGSERSCDGLDNDCDGDTDEGLEPPEGLCPVSGCAGAAALCLGDLGWQCAVEAAPRCGAAGVCAGVASAAAVCGPQGWECVAAPVELYEPFEEARCDGLDNDCDGDTDEGLCGTCGPWPVGGLDCTTDDAQTRCGLDGWAPLLDDDPALRSCADDELCLGPGLCVPLAELRLTPGRGLVDGATPALAVRAAGPAEPPGGEHVIVVVPARPEGQARSSLYLVELDPFGTFGGELWLGSNASSPRIAASPTSRPGAPCALLVWRELHAEGPGLLGAWVGSGCEQAPDPMVVAPAAAVEPLGPAVAVNSEGVGVAVWTDGGPAGERAIQVSLLRPGAPPRRLHPEGLLRELRADGRTLSWLGRPAVAPLPSGGFVVVVAAVDPDSGLGGLFGLGLDDAGGLLPGWESPVPLSEHPAARVDAAALALLPSPVAGQGVGPDGDSAPWAQWHLVAGYRRRGAHDPSGGTWILRRLEPLAVSAAPDAPAAPSPAPVDGEVELGDPAASAPVRLELLPLPGGRLVGAATTNGGLSLQTYTRWLRPSGAPHPPVGWPAEEMGWAAATLSGDRLVLAQPDGEGGLIVHQRELSCPPEQDFCDPLGERRRCDRFGRGPVGARGCPDGQRCVGAHAECVPATPEAQLRPPEATSAPDNPSVAADDAGNVLVAATYWRGLTTDQVGSWTPNGAAALAAAPLHFTLDISAADFFATDARVAFFEPGRLAVAYDGLRAVHCVGVFTLAEGLADPVGTQRCFDEGGYGIPDVAALPAGGFVTATQGGGQTVELRVWERSGGVVWQAAPMAAARWPSLAAFPDVGFAVATQRDGAVALQVYEPGGEGGEPFVPAGVGPLRFELAAASDARASVAATGDGRLALAVRGLVAGRETMALVAAQRSPEPATLGPAEALETQAWLPIEDPTLVALPGADVAAFWIAAEPLPEGATRWHLRSRRMALQQPGPWQEPRSLVSAAVALRQVRATRLPRGGVLVVWLEGVGPDTVLRSLVIEPGEG